MGSPDIDVFLKDVMNVQVLRAGGASAGMFGQVGADNDVVNDLRKNAVAFAREYRKPQADHNALHQLADDLEGSLRILQLTHTLSEEHSQKLTGELHALLEERQR